MVPGSVRKDSSGATLFSFFGEGLDLRRSDGIGGVCNLRATLSVPRSGCGSLFGGQAGELDQLIRANYTGPNHPGKFRLGSSFFTGIMNCSG
jgi:hypothetical protein